MKLRLKITPKLTLVFVLFAALLLMGVGGLVYTSGRATLEAATISDLQSTALEKEAALNTWIRDQQMGLVALTNSVNLGEAVAALVAAPPNSAEAQAAHNRVMRELQPWAGPGRQYVELLVIGVKTGRVMAATDPGEEGKFKENRPYFIHGQNGPYVQHVYYSLALQSPTMTAAAPLRSADGHVVGVLAGELDLEAMNVIVNRRTGLHQTDDALLVNTSNLFVTQPRFLPDPVVLRRGVRTVPVERCLTRSSGVVSTEDYRGVPVIAVYRWLPDSQLCLIVKLEQTEAFAPIQAFGQTILVGGGLALLAASILAMGLARTITQPILALQAGASRLGQGELEARLPETSSDELGQLAREFNTMAAALAEKEAQLRRYTEELEQMVQERTATLRESQVDLNRAQAVAHTGSWRLDVRKDELLWSDETHRMFGIPLGTPLTYETFLATVHPDDRDFVDRSWTAALRGEPYDIEHRIVVGDHVRWVRERAELEFDPQGMLLGGFGTVQDITERKQAEEALRRSEAVLAQAGQMAHLGAWEIEFNNDEDINATPLRWSDEVYRIFGYEPGEVEVSNDLFFERVHPDDRQGIAAAVAQALAEKRPYQIEHRIVRPDGVERVVLERAEITFDPQGRPLHMIGAVQDITERKQAEEQFRLLVEASPSAIMLINMDHQITLVNARAEALFGYTRQELIGQSVELLVPPQFRAQHRHYRASFFVAPQARSLGVGRDIFGWRKDGSQVPVEIGLTPITTSEGTFVLATIIDIAERKQAEEALRESEERLRLALMAANQGLYDLNVQTGEAQVSPEYATMLGYAPATFHETNARWIERLHPDDRERVAETYRAYVRGEIPVYAVEFRQRTRSGDWKWILSLGKIVARDAAGNPLRMLGTHTDITVRKQAEESLRESEEKYRLLFAEMLSGFALHEIITDEAGRPNDYRFITVNAAFEAMTGLSAKDIIGRTVREVLSGIEPYWIERYGQVALTGASVQFEDYSSDLQKYFEVRAYCPKRGQFAVIFHDITERKRAEEELHASEVKYRNALDAMLEGCQIIGFDWRYLYLNDVADKHNRRPKETLLGHKYMDMWPGIEATEVFGVIRRCMEERVPQSMENEFTFPDGSKGWFDLKIYPVPEGIVVLSLDITERKQAEEAIRQLNQELEQRVVERTAQLEAANKELEAFSYSVSHDLRAPLRGIDGFSQALLEDYADKLDAEGQKHLQRVRAASQRMAQLIDDLLTLSRITRSEMSRERVNLSELAQVIAEQLRQAEPDRQVEFVIADAALAQADSRLIRVVLENLLGNAWKFTAKHACSRIEFGTLRQHNGQLAYFVRDDGAGFDMAYADKLFGAFQRLHTPAEFPGSGIGLATVQRIVHRHGGRLWAEGAVEQGATFYFTL
jgi:PAS domain S-box-containing protein